MKRILTVLSIAVYASAILASCVETPSEEPVTGVKLSDSEIELIEGQTHNLTATVLPESATDKALEWKTSNKQDVMLFQNGVLLFSSSFRSAFDPYCIIE